MMQSSSHMITVRKKSVKSVKYYIMIAACIVFVLSTATVFAKTSLGTQIISRGKVGIRTVGMRNM